MTERLHLLPRHRERLEALLCEHLPGVEVWAYGSRVNGRSHDGSDLDLVLRGRGLDEIELSALADFTQALHDSTIPFLVEARDWARLPERFHREIERAYVGVEAPFHLRQPSVTRRGAPGDAPVTAWRECELGEVIELKRGYDLPKQRRLSGTFPVVSSSGPTDFHSESKVRGPGVVTGRYGTLGRVYFVREDFWPLNTALYVRDFRGNDPRFISYFLSQLDFAAYSDKAAVPGLNRNHLHREAVRFPATVGEQRAIAHILGTLDDKIELNRRMNETLEAMARALFKSWFVDFDPVRAKMEGRDTGLPQDIADLFSDRLVDSEMGEIPEGWKVEPLRALIDVNPKRPLRRGEVVPYLPMANMPTRGHVPTSVDLRPFGSGMRFANGDTLVARITPCLENGKTAFVDFLREDEVGWGSTEYIVLRPKPPLPDQFAYCLARSAVFREFAIRNMSGTSGRQRVPAAAVKGFLMVAPPVRLSEQFGEVARPLFERASRAGRESGTLVALRDTLLPKLISGEIRVPDAERALEAGT